MSDSLRADHAVNETLEGALGIRSAGFERTAPAGVSPPAGVRRLPRRK